MIGYMEQVVMKTLTLIIIIIMVSIGTQFYQQLIMEMLYIVKIITPIFLKIFIILVMMAFLKPKMIFGIV